MSENGNSPKGIKLRLLKVLVQPVFVVDDGEELREETGPAIPIPPAEWPDFPAELERQRESTEKQMAEALTSDSQEHPDTG